jgi:signal transduction histidine kinase
VQPDGDCILVRVTDSGIGIPAAELPTIFDRFSRASNVGGRPGSGLGLSMVRNMVEAMEGEISVESVEGKGSTFTVRLPAA